MDSRDGYFIYFLLLNMGCVGNVEENSIPELRKWPHGAIKPREIPPTERMCLTETHFKLSFSFTLGLSFKSVRRLSRSTSTKAPLLKTPLAHLPVITEGAMVKGSKQSFICHICISKSTLIQWSTAATVSEVNDRGSVTGSFSCQSRRACGGKWAVYPVGVRGWTASEEAATAYLIRSRPSEGK